MSLQYLVFHPIRTPVFFLYPFAARPEIRRVAMDLAAASQKLPVPVVRTMNSQKSPWMVKLSDLAVYIDAQHERYRKTWEKVQGVL